MLESSSASAAHSHRIADAAEDWPVQATDAIVNIVDTVRDKTTNQALRIARGAVLGIIVAVLGGVVGVLALLATTRGMQIVLDNQQIYDLSREQAVWITYVGMGSTFIAVGLFLLRKRAAPSVPAF